MEVMKKLRNLANLFIEASNCCRSALDPVARAYIAVLGKEVRNMHTGKYVDHCWG